MRRLYYFDIREADDLMLDDERSELASMEEVQEEAVHSLAELARDAARRMARDGKALDMAIEVRDDDGPLMQVRFTFDVKRLRQ